MIVECPACKTKFAIDTKQVAHVESPRFHCELCDERFTLNLVPPKRFRSESSTATMTTAAPTYDQSGGIGMLQSASCTSGTQTAQHHLQRDLLTHGEIPDVAVSWPSAATDQVLEVDMRAFISHPSVRWSKMDQDEVEQTHSADQESFERTDCYDESAFTIDQELHSTTNFNTLRAPVLDQTFRTRTPSVLPVHSQIIDRFIDEAVIESSIANEDRDNYGLKPPTKTQGLSLNSSLLMLFPACVVLAFLAVGKVMEFSLVSPNPAEQSSVVLPPQGLALESVTGSIATLHNGKQIYVVEGILNNETAYNFRNVTLEAKLYDKQNVEISRVTIFAENALSSVNTFQTLEPEKILELQSEKAAKSDVIQSLAKKQVRAIFTENAAQAAWISIRPYSVEQAGASS